MIIHDAYSYAIVKEATTDELRTLDKMLKIKADPATLRHSVAYKRKRWDGYYHFFNRKKMAFPAGLIPIIKKKFPSTIEIIKYDHDVDVDINRVTDLIGVSPRDYQEEAAKAGIVAGRGLIEVPTGGGKTLIMSSLCKAINGRILVLVHTKNLLTQAHKDLSSRLGEDVGMVGGGCHDEKRVTVATIQTARKVFNREDKMQFDAVILDECHHASADTFYDMLLSIPAPFRIGLSADPLDTHKTKPNNAYNRLRVLSCFGPILYRVGVDRLKELGHLATPTVYFKQIDANSGEDTDYADAYCAAHCENNELHEEVMKIVGENVDKQTLILVRHIHHGEELESLIPGSVFLSGQDDNDKIEKYKEKFKAKGMNLLIASGIFTEGTDLPGIEVLINAAGDVAPTKQRLGRGLRAKKGDNTVVVYDFFPFGNRHTERHAEKRMDIYKNEGHKVELL